MSDAPPCGATLSSPSSLPSTPPPLALLCLLPENTRLANAARPVLLVDGLSKVVSLENVVSLDKRLLLYLSARFSMTWVVGGGDGDGGGDGGGDGVGVGV